MELADISLLPERIAQKIVFLESGCWQWTGYVSRAGYGQASDRNPGGGWRKSPVHRMTWRALVGPIPEGTELDHLCHTEDPTCRMADLCLHRRCVNPDHLEPVTPEENRRRSRGLSYDNVQKTHCPKGHELTGDNLVYIKDKPHHRVCRTCVNANQRARARAKKDRKRAMVDAERGVLR